MLAGGIGAAVLAMVGPLLMHNYTEAVAEDRALIAAQFAVFFELVWRAIWQILSNDWNGPWVQIDGNAEVLHMPEATERALARASRSGGRQSGAVTP